MPIAPGTRLGRYRLTERAGAGGMSEVWKAEDETLHRTVAVKVIHGPIAQDASYRERFLREARLVAGLDNPHVLPVYDFGSETIDGAEVPFLVMPLVGGGSLKERIRGPIPPAQAIPWLLAIADALDGAHAKGILHRDIKPGNVLMGTGDRPLLADFGLARAVESASGLTQTGTVLGTPLYMAPEQATGKPLDARADQYALAVIAYEMLSGRVPFRADSPLAVLHQHVSVPPEPISRVVEGLPAHADAVMQRALAKRPEERFAKCTDFVAALAQALGVPITAATAPVSVASSAPAAPPVPPTAPLPAGFSQQATVIDAPPAPPPLPAVSAPEPVLAAPASQAAAPGRRRALVVLLPLAVLAVTAAILFGLKGGRAGTKLAQIPSTIPPETPGLPTAVPSAGPTVVPTGLPPGTPVPTAAPAEPSPTPAPTVTPTLPPPTAIPKRGKAPRGSYEERFGERAPASEAPLPRREPLLLKGMSADTTLGSAFDALDPSRKSDGKLSRADFVSAMGEARSALGRRQTADAAFLDAFARAGVAFADGQRIQAWQLLRRAFEHDPGAAGSRRLRFVRREAQGLGPNPGPDADWLMGLAFADVRGDLADELAKAAARDDSPAVLYAQALHALDRRDPDARRYARRACEGGLREACEIR